MNNNPLISIIIPSYNQGKYIEQTILSILDQDYKNIELIIIDGGSKDETVSIIKKYEKQIAYWVSESDRGQAHAINKGLEKATGDIFNWLNSDDHYEPGALKAVANAFTQNKNAELVCGYTRCYWEADGSTSHTYRMGIKDTVAQTLKPVEMNQPGSFYKTEIVKKIGGVNESLRYVFDSEFWCRYTCKYGTQNVVKIDNLLAQFRLHEASKSIGEGFDGFNEELAILYYDILKNCKVPDWLLEKMQKENKKYKSRGAWDLQALEQEKFVASFASTFVNCLYTEGNRAAAKDAMERTIEEGFFRWTRMMTSLRLKLMFA